MDVALTGFKVHWNRIFAYSGWSVFKNPSKHLVHVMDMEGKSIRHFFSFSEEDSSMPIVRNVFSVQGKNLCINIPFSDIIYSLDRDLNIQGRYLLSYEETTNSVVYQCFKEDEFKSVIFFGDGLLCTTRTSRGGLQWGIKQPAMTECVMFRRIQNSNNKGVLEKLFGRPISLMNDSVLIDQIEPGALLRLKEFYKDDFNGLPPCLRDVVAKIQEDENPILVLHEISINH